MVRIFANFRPIRTFFTIIVCFSLFDLQKQSEGLKNRENSGFLVSELEVGSGEQDIFIFF